MSRMGSGTLYCRPVTLDVVQAHFSDDEREVYRISMVSHFTGRPGALLHLEDRDAPICPACGDRIRPADRGRFLYYRPRQDPEARQSTRFAHDRCLRQLVEDRERNVTIGNAWVPNYGELGGVF